MCEFDKGGAKRMGMIDIDKRTQKCIDGKEFVFTAWTSIAELSTPEDGTLDISIREKSKQEVEYALHICLADYDEKWFKKFALAFANVPEWREQFKVIEQTGQWHPTTNVELPSGEKVNSLPKLPQLPENVVKCEKKSGIAKLVNKGHRAKFKDYAQLRSGRDQFSSMKMDDLIANLDDDNSDVDAVMDGLDNEKMQASALRWILRGLPVQMAIRKVKTDAELAENARGRR
jgi:hypothetical protein